jgi:hypothetical protein
VFWSHTREEGHTGGKIHKGVLGKMDGLGLIRQPLYVREEIAFLSTFKVVPVLVHFHSLRL